MLIIIYALQNYAYHNMHCKTMLIISILMPMLCPMHCTTMFIISNAIPMYCITKFIISNAIPKH